jgi:hypothetical protein
MQEAQGSALVMQTVCKFICIAGVLALFGVYAFSNPDLVTPEGAEGPIHCFVKGGSFRDALTGALVVDQLLDGVSNSFTSFNAQCTPCPFPYTNYPMYLADGVTMIDYCDGTDVT